MPRIGKSIETGNNLVVVRDGGRRELSGMASHFGVITCSGIR